MLKILFLSAPITFYILSEGSAFFYDPKEPRGFPVVMFEVTMLFAFVYPIIAAAIVWFCESSVRLKRWSMAIGFALSLVLLVFLFWEFASTTGKFRDYLVLTGFWAYGFIVSTGLSALTGRLSIRLWTSFRYVSLKLKNLSRALPD
jgi:hypothetical protein